MVGGPRPCFDTRMSHGGSTPPLASQDKQNRQARMPVRIKKSRKKKFKIKKNVNLVLKKNNAGNPGHPPKLNNAGNIVVVFTKKG